MRLTSKLTNDARFEADLHGFNVVMDGNGQEGPSPPEVVVAALAACVGIYAVNFCVKHGIATDGLAVHADWEKAALPARIGKIEIAIDLPAGVPAAHYEAFMKTVEACLIHNSFTHPPEISMRLHERVG